MSDQTVQLQMLLADADAEVKRLRAALERIAQHGPNDRDNHGRWTHWAAMAREALAPSQSEER